jgi:hypothetical protein
MKHVQRLFAHFSKRRRAGASAPASRSRRRLKPALYGDMKRRIACAVIIAMPALGCQSSQDSPTTTPTSPGASPSADVVNVAGNWVGTLESTNIAAQTISMVVVQFGNCVDGSWKSADGDWTGAMSGFAMKDSFSGQITFERRSNGGCLASGNVGGDVGSDTLRWTGIGATPIGQCAGNIPQSIVISMRRQ